MIGYHCGFNPAVSITFFHFALSAPMWRVSFLGVAGALGGAALADLVDDRLGL